MEELTNVISLQDEEGKEVRFEFLDVIELEGDEFVVLLPLDEPDVGEVVILRLDSTDDDDEFGTYVSVDDDALLERVFSIFKEKFADESNFVD